jgi:hypothetical protein
MIALIRAMPIPLLGTVCGRWRRAGFSHSGNVVPNIGRPLRDSALGRFILQNIPVSREHAVGYSDDIGGDPISGPSSSRKPAMDDHVTVFSNDQARLVLQRRWRAPNQIEQAVAPRRDVRAVLNVVR